MKTIRPNSRYLVMNIFYRILYAIFFAFIPFFVIFIVSLPIGAVINALVSNDEKFPPFSFVQYMLIYGITALFTFLIMYISDYLYVKESSITQNDNSLDVITGGFRRNKFSCPIAKISDMEVHQGIIEKMAGISTVNLTTEDDDIILRGVLYQDADKFVSDVTSRFKIKISS